MREFLRLLVGLLFLTGCSTVAPNSPDIDISAKAMQVIAASKKATGDSAWDALEGSYEEGKHGETPFKTWLDFKQLGTRTEAAAGGGAMAMGFNGKVAWQSRGGQSRTIASGPAFVEAMMTAFVATNGFYFPDRFAAKLSYLRSVNYADTKYDVVEVVPNGGRAIELWFDRKSHYLARLVDAKGPQPVILELSDYRKVGDVMIAYHARVTDPSGQPLEDGQVALVEHRKVPRSVFEPDKAAN